MKLLVIVVTGFFATLISTAFSVVAVNKMLGRGGEGSVPSAGQSSGGDDLDGDQSVEGSISDPTPLLIPPPPPNPKTPFTERELLLR